MSWLRDMVLGDPSYSNPPVGGPAGTLARDWMREK